MKKIIHTLVLVLAFGFLKAQFVFSSVWSDYTPTYTLTSGFNTTTTAGFMWCGYQPQLNLGNYPWSPNNLNIFVRGYGFSSMWTSYKIYEGIPGLCNGPLTQILNGNGVSMTEVYYKLGAGLVRYAMAGAYDTGAYFIAITSGGTPVSTKLYPFPQGLPPNAPAPTRPILTQDGGTTDFYVAGAVAGQMYVMRVDLAGNQIWSKKVPMNGNVTPKDLVVYPSQNGNLLIAGVIENNGDTDGFVADLNCANGQVNSVKRMGNQGLQDGINTIILSNSNNNNPSPEIILGGYAESNNANLESWITKMDLQGNVLWSHYLQPATGTNYGIVDMLERISTTYNYEIYALVYSASGMVVCKLDNLGQPFPVSASAQANEFMYNLGGTTNSMPSAISMINSPTNAPDLGLQVYGTANNITSASTSHMVQAYFNGETNCNKILQVQNSPVMCYFQKNNVNCIGTVGLSSCNNFTAAAFYPGGAINFPCTGYMVSGDNARSIATNIAEQNNTSQADFKVQPNPTDGKTSVVFSAEAGERVSIAVTDVLGRKITEKNITCDYSGAYEEEISLMDAQLKSGVYYVSLNISGKVQQQKIMLSN